MPKLLLPTSPCLRCSNLVQEVPITYNFEEEGVSTTLALESCPIQTYLKFQECRHGIAVGEETRFPWCAFLKPKQTD